MESFFSRYKNALVLIAVLLAQVLGLAMQVHREQRGATTESSKVMLLRYWANATVSPFERALMFVGHGVRNGWNGYLDLRHVRQQNQDLKSEVARLRLEQAGLARDARQGKRLQALLGFTEKYIYKTVAAQVIGTGGSDQSHVFYVDKGSADGIQADMPVITPDGIVGKVREAYPHTAMILEIDDSTSGAGAVLETTRIRGVLRGVASGQFPLMYVLPDERIKPGEQVLTSGGDQVFPPGLPIGRVQAIRTDPDHDPYVDVIVKPAADLERLEEVLIVTDVQSRQPPATASDVQGSEALAADQLADQQKAASIVAERLPGLKDPNAPATAAAPVTPAAPGTAPTGTAANPVLPAVKDLQALHPDRYTPGDTPDASQLTPGAPSHGSAASAGATTGNDRKDQGKPQP